jgi:hypothetical protein
MNRTVLVMGALGDIGWPMAARTSFRSSRFRSRHSHPSCRNSPQRTGAGFFAASYRLKEILA